MAALRENPGDATLSAAREAWVAARVPWEASEGFLFGPVDFNGYDPALDSWPVNRTDLQGVMASGNDLGTEYVNGLYGTLKGFHTIEYLLFDEGGSKTASDFTGRQFDYLVASALLLAQTAKDLHASWIPSGGNFVAKVLQAGGGSDVYPSQRSAVQEIVNGMIGICDEVANGKIADPFSEQDPRLVESQFSFNSLDDFQNNMRSVWNAYTGDYGGREGPGLDGFVAPAERRPRPPTEGRDPGLHRRDRPDQQSLPRRHRQRRGADREGAAGHRTGAADFRGGSPAAGAGSIEGGRPGSTGGPEPPLVRRGPPWPRRLWRRRPGAGVRSPVPG